MIIKQAEKPFGTTKAWQQFLNNAIAEGNKNTKKKTKRIAKVTMRGKITNKNFCKAVKTKQYKKL